MRRAVINANAANCRQAPGPVPVPHRRPLGVRNTCIEADASLRPPIGGAHSARELDGIVVRMVVTKCLFGVPKQVLAINKRDGALRFRLYWHRSRANNPAGAFRQVRRGTISGNVSSRVTPVKTASRVPASLVTPPLPPVSGNIRVTSSRIREGCSDPVSPLRYALINSSSISDGSMCIKILFAAISPVQSQAVQLLDCPVAATRVRCCAISPVESRQPARIAQPQGRFRCGVLKRFAFWTSSDPDGRLGFLSPPSTLAVTA